VYVCSLSYPARKAHAPCYIFFYGLSGSTIFFHFILQTVRFSGGGGGDGEVWNIKCVFWFYLQLLCETFLIPRIRGRVTIIKVHRTSCKVPVILSYFNKTGIFWADFRKILKYQISWKSVQLNQSFSVRIGVRRDETDSRLSGILGTHLKMNCVIDPSSYPMSIFKEAYHKLLAIKKNCFTELFGQISYKIDSCNKWDLEGRFKLKTKRHSVGMKYKMRSVFAYL
jgi:hypothetical protein